MGSPTRELPIHLLAEAAEIEHNLLCSYLYAAFSLKAPGEGLNDAEGAAVARWRKRIVAIAVEEMAHLAQVNNLLVALGGPPHFDRANLPVAPGYHPAGFVVRLTPFTRATLDHFIFLERPAEAAIADGRDFVDPKASPRTPTRGSLTPSTPDYDTIGEFYEAIRVALKALADAEGRNAFIDQTGALQLSRQDVALEGLTVVRDLETALSAIETIVEQGEGASHDCETCHFSRFAMIKTEWDALLRQNPTFEPGFPAAHDPVMRRPAADVERVWITHPRAAAVLDLGNAIYGFMLTLLEQVYAPGLESAHRRRFVAAALALMPALSHVGAALARMPATDEKSQNAGLTFAVPRSVRARVPSYAAAMAVERLKELRDGWHLVMPDSNASRLEQALAELEGAPPA
jgi:hypothetical protein